MDMVENTEAKIEPDAKYLAKLFFHSYRYSQGSPNLQSYIFDYLHILHPDWRISVETSKKIVEITLKPSEAFTTKASPHGYHNQQSNPDISNELSATVKNMAATFDTAAPPEKIAILTHILEGIIERDAVFLSRGRRRINWEGRTDNPFLDPYLSHFRYWSLEGHTTGIPEYDQMFKELKELFTNKDKWPITPFQQRVYRENLRQLKRDWEKHHPGQKFFMEDYGGS